MTATTTSISPDVRLALLLSDPNLGEGDREQLREMIGGLYDWEKVMGILFVHRTVGIAWQNITELGYEAYSSIQARYLLSGMELTYKAQELHVVDQMKHTSALMAEFDAQGIECVLLKGAAVARTGYRSPGMRLFGDNDLLFRRSDLGRVGKVLREAGYQQGWWDTDAVVPASRKQIMLYSVHAHQTVPYVRATPGMPIISCHEIDVHFSVDLLTNNNSDDVVDELLSRRVSLDGPGGAVWTPHPEDLFCFVAVHVEREASHISEVMRTQDLLLYKLLDMLAMIESKAIDLDLVRLVERAEELRMSRELYFALHHLDVMYPGRVGADVLAAVRPESSDYVNQVRDNNGPLHTWKVPLAQRFFDSQRQQELADVIAAWPKPEV